MDRQREVTSELGSAAITPAWRDDVIQRAQEWLDGDQAKYTVDWVVELIRDLKDALLAHPVAAAPASHQVNAEREEMLAVLERAYGILSQYGGGPERHISAAIWDVLQKADAEPSPAAAPAWQEMESAPKDGTRVICWGPKLAVTECEYRQEWYGQPEGWYRSNQHPRVEPTLWMPLPPGPSRGDTR